MGLLELRDEHHYRARTQTDKSVAGVTQPSFRCTRCGQYRRTKGRKRLGKGYVCAPCLQPPSTT